MSAWAAAVQSVGTLALLGLAVVLLARLHWLAVMPVRRAGLTQKEIADTAGVSDGTVNGDLKFSSENDEPEPITNSRGQQRPATYSRGQAPQDAA